jgi:uncharacterized membrane protein (Fun14 family)
MTSFNDLMRFAGTIGGGFFVGLLAGYVIKFKKALTLSMLSDKCACRANAVIRIIVCSH